MHEQAAQTVEEQGFPEAARLLRAGLVHAARNNLRRLEPADIGEAGAKRRAMAALPESEED